MAVNLCASYVFIITAFSFLFFLLCFHSTAFFFIAKQFISVLLCCWVNKQFHRLFQHLRDSLGRNLNTSYIKLQPSLKCSHIQLPRDHRGVGTPVKSHFFLCGFFCLTVCGLIQLPESHAGVCLPPSLLSTMFSLSTDLHVTVFLPPPPRLSVSLSVPSVSPCIEIHFPSSYVDISHSLPRGLGSVCSLPFCGAQLLCLPGASTGVKPL